MQWFRMYAEMPDDPKIGTLSDGAFRTWVDLLCAACKEGNSGDTGLTSDSINWSLRRNVTETLQELLLKQLIIEETPENIQIVNWMKRQQVSDNSTNRVRKYRESKKKKNETVTVTEMKRYGNGAEEIRREKNIKEKDKDKSLSKKKGQRLSPDWMLPEDWIHAAKEINPETNTKFESEKFKDYWLAVPGQKGVKLDWKATWRNWIRNANGAKQPSPHDPLDDIPGII